MTNDDIYAAGLLNRALDPTTHPPAISAFLHDETERLLVLVGDGRRVIDFGCGTGRHLAALAPRLAWGVGIDNQPAYLRKALQSGIRGPVHFAVGDATRVPCGPAFDLAICMTNTWGTLPEKRAVLAEMRRVAPDPGRRIISVYAPTSVAARREWYARLDREVVVETDEYLETTDGFRSEHFTVERLHQLIGSCDVEPIGDIGYLVVA